MSSTTRICQKGGVPLDGEGRGPTQRHLEAERTMDVQELPKDYKRFPNVICRMCKQCHVGNVSLFLPFIVFQLNHVGCFSEI